MVRCARCSMVPGCRQGRSKSRSSDCIRASDPMSTQSQTDTTAHGSSREREIVDAKVIVTCPGRNFVTLKITTRSGVTGLGDATLNGRELAVASYLSDHLVPNLIG